MAPRCLRSGCRPPLLLLLVLLLPPLEVQSQDDFNLADALDDNKPSTPSPKPAAPAGGAELDQEDFFKFDATTTTKAPPKIAPQVPTATKAPVKPKPKPKPKPADGDFNLADALDPNNDIDKNSGRGGRRYDGQDDTYKPDQGIETTAEVGTIAGIVSAVAMALAGAVSSYISYQKKKLCFGVQQSLNAEMVKAENPEAVVATEPQVQQTLLEPPKAEPPIEENAV